MAEQGEGINPAEHHYNLPVERFEHNGEWVFKASQLRLHQESSELWMQTGRIENALRAVQWAANNQGAVESEFGPGAVTQRFNGRGV